MSNDNERLILPGDIPGLLRRGSPVWRARFVGGLSCVCLTPAEGTKGVVLVARPDKCTEWYKSAELALDLSDPTGRFHAILWLADKLDWLPAELLLYFSVGGDFIEVNANGFDWDALYNEIGFPDTERTLPDGSYWIDAEALRLAVLHVANRPVTP